MLPPTTLSLLFQTSCQSNKCLNHIANFPCVTPATAITRVALPKKDFKLTIILLPQLNGSANIQSETKHCWYGA